jgi:hypothetical protein
MFVESGEFITYVYDVVLPFNVLFTTKFIDGAPVGGDITNW